jgi:GNAT superfamily N-acetyltransferase
VEDLTIRKYRREDRDSVRGIAWDTAFMGKPADRFFSDRKILADFLTLYFTDYEPQSCYVALAAGEIAGYLIGAKNTAVLDKVSADKIIPYLLFKAIARNTLFKKKNFLFCWHSFLSCLSGEFRAPDFSGDYPATLHINLKEKFRNFGIGSALIAAYLDYLKEEKIRGVRLATFSQEAGPFFRKNGFELLYRHSRSYFKYVLGKEVQVYIYGKKLQDWVL